MADKVDASGRDTRDRTVGQSGSSNATSGANISDDELNCYKMNHSNRGIAVIINNKNFNPETGLEERKGTDTDAESMYELLDTLGFEIIRKYDDLTAKQMKDCLTEASKADHRNNDCFVCVLLSHGKKDDLVHGVDTSIAIKDLVRPFKGNNCPSLAGKPKLFFIQACRGKQFDCGATVSDAVGDEEDENVEVRHIPTEADFLMAYSVAPGFYSWRHANRGSWFIQAVAKVLMEKWETMDVITMMTRVNRLVAYDFESSTKIKGLNKMKQIPCITSMLTKDVFFKK